MSTGKFDNYGVLKGQVASRQLASTKSEHYQLLVNKGNHPHRVAINTLSQANPKTVLFYHDDDFKHPITDAILAANLPTGYTVLRPAGGNNFNVKGICLDMLRSNLFHVFDLKPLQASAAGPDNDLNDKLDNVVNLAINDPSVVLYAFGQHWTDNSGADHYFPEINPSTGVHQIHMNQGNPEGSSFYSENGVYQDGGLLFHFPNRNKWVAIFTAFQSQIFHTDDVNGNPLPGFKPGVPQEGVTTPSVHIMAAMVNPAGSDPGKEYVILLNSGSSDANLQGWKIADSQKNTDTIHNMTITAGNTLTVKLNGTGAQLSNKGGIITLLDNNGVKVNGVSYTKAQASNEGVLVKF